MELRHFRYFVGVAEELHFGRAAERLGISQPPLSQQIRALEAELGVELFERTSRRVRLTEAGTAFLDEARKTLAQAEHAVATARRADRGEIGELTIGFITSAPLTPLVSTALFDFREAYPAVYLDLTEMPRAAQVERLIERRLDVGFIRGVEPPVLPPSLVATMVLEEDILVAMRTDHRLASLTGLSIVDLFDEAFVLYESKLGSGFNEHLTQLCRQAGFEPRVVQEVGALSTLLGLVAAGFGITVLARSLAALHLDNLVYLPMNSPGAVSRLWLIHHREMSPVCRKLVDIVTGWSKPPSGE
nr:LysR substrate-binding domain-containing protein [Polymorphobacter sp.]